MGLVNAKDHVYVHPSFLFLSQLFCSKWNSETLFFCVPVSMDRKAECNCKECDECLGLGNLDTPPKSKFGHPKNQHAYQATEKYFAREHWKLTADDNVIDDALQYQTALMVRDKLRATVGKKSFQKQPERFAEGQRRVAAMTRKLDAYHDMYRVGENVDEVDNLMAQGLAIVVDEKILENTQDRLMKSFKDNAKKMRKLHETKSICFRKLVDTVDGAIQQNANRHPVLEDAHAPNIAPSGCIASFPLDILKCVWSSPHHSRAKKP